MNTIVKHISQLLFHHECVILPNFGGFVCNYKPAYIQSVQHKIHPPSKQITFNKNLINNDGLLVNFVADKEGVAYEQALKKIENFVLSVKSKLKLEQEVCFEDIGTFVMDKEGRIYFEPSSSENYLLTAYGLTSIQVTPIVREKYEEKIVAQVKALPKNKSNVRKWVAAAAVIIPLGFFAFWIPTKYDLSSNINYAKLNPFTEEKPATYSPSEVTLPEESHLASLSDELSKADSTPYLSFSWIKDQEPITIALEEKHIAVADTTRVAKKNIPLRYHIIAGCFSEKKNAKKMVKKLKSKGFEAWIVGQRKGLWTVSYNSFTTREKAVDALAFAKADNDKAWILEM